jgi:hypothetical protein
MTNNISQLERQNRRLLKYDTIKKMKAYEKKKAYQREWASNLRDSKNKSPAKIKLHSHEALLTTYVPASELKRRYKERNG